MFGDENSNLSDRKSTSMGGWHGVLCFFVFMVLLAMPVHANEINGESQTFQPFSFVLTGDPQIGYGNGFEQGSYQRFIDQAKVLNHLSLDFVIFPGDLVHANNPYQWKLFVQGLNQYTMPVYMIPGNHDVQTRLELERYKDRFGADYYDFVINNCAFVMINSETARDGALDYDQHLAHWNWLERTLQDHQLANRKYTFLVMHRPLYKDDVGEKSGYKNWPVKTRSKLINMIRKYNVSAVLAGHLHQTHELVLNDSQVPVYVVGGTSRIWDDNGYGYRWFTVDQNGIHQNYQRFEPTWPKHWHFAGITGWSPPILKYEPFHLGLVCSYVLTVLLCFRAYRHWKHARQTRPTTFWKYTTLMVLFFGLNHALGFNDLLLLFGFRLDYLPMQAQGGLLLPLLSLSLLPLGAGVALVVYHRYYIAARYGWPTLLGMIVAMSQFVMSFTIYEPWFTWTQSSPWQITALSSSLLIGLMALGTASLSNKKNKVRGRAYNPKQINTQHARRPVPKRALKPKPVTVKSETKIVNKSQQSLQNKSVPKQAEQDAIFAAMLRSGKQK